MTLYPDVVKIKAIIVETQNFEKMPFFINYKSISDNSAAWTMDVVATGLPDYGFVNNKQMAFLQIFFSQQLLSIIFKTSGYNVEYDGLWGRLNRSLFSTPNNPSLYEGCSLGTCSNITAASEENKLRLF